ncbi:MAG: hypothetical protein RIR97_1750 [Pseudomonadota bacterium]
MTMHFWDRKTALASAILVFASVCLPNVASAESHLFDEIRVMPNLDVGNAARRESGVFVNAMVLFDPLDAAHATGADLMARPRLHIGANLSTEGKTSQIYGGFSWKIPLNDLFFVDFGIGGTVHNGRVSNEGPGPDLGCSLLFHEYAGVGYQIDPNWSLMATIDHSSHAGMCNRMQNQGITHGGLAVGYKF